MTCPEIHPLLQAYTDGELDLLRSLEVERHLETCPACAVEKASLNSLSSSLRNSDLEYRASSSLRHRVLQIARPAVEPSRSREFIPLQLWKLLAFGATAFAVLTLLLRPAATSGPAGFADEAVSAHVRSLMADHLTDVASTDQHTVKPWFAGRTDVSPEVGDFAAQGYRLLGGRVEVLDHQRAAVLVYQHGAHFINVYTWAIGSGGVPQNTMRRGYRLAFWKQGDLGYCAVSDAGWSELAVLAGLIKDLGTRDLPH